MSKFTPPPMTPPTTGGDFAPFTVPAGTYPARCTWLLMIGTQKEVYKGEDKIMKKVLIGFELPTIQLPADHPKAGEPAFISGKYTYSLADKANLRADINSWRGKGLTDEEAAAFDIGKLIGAPAVITVIHNTGKDGSKTYANISSIAPEKSMEAMIPGFKVPAQINPSLYFSVDWLTSKEGAEYAMPIFDKIPKYYQDMIMKSDEWMEYARQPFYIAPAVAPGSTQTPPAAAQQSKPVAVPPPLEPLVEDNSDPLPF